MLILGRAGIGKSHLIKPIFMVLSKLLLYKRGNPDKPRTLLLALTGVEVVNVGATTIHKVLGIGIGSKLALLSDKLNIKLREKLSHMKLIILDHSCIYIYIYIYI